jgi:hypothetical protein
MSKDHGEHNEELCEKIENITGFDDWVITTAFYACIHFVEYKLFPLTIGQTTYQTFDKFYHDTVRTQGKKADKHSTKHLLVKNNLPAVANNYKRLMDNCFKARYRNYRMGSLLAEIAIKDMKAVKQACV